MAEQPTGSPLVGRVPQVGQHVDAAPLELGRLGILVLVDQVLVDAEVHQLVDLRLLPGLAEGGQVLAGVAVEEQLVGDRLERLGRPHLVVGTGVDGRVAFRSRSAYIESSSSSRTDSRLCNGMAGPLGSIWSEAVPYRSCVGAATPCLWHAPTLRPTVATLAVLAEALRRAWRLGAGPGAERCVVDLDSTIG